MRSILLVSLFIVFICLSEACSSKKEIVQPLKPTANFTYELGKNGSIVLKNTSQNATSYQWDFGDGNKSDLENPIHNYGLSKSYQIKLIAASKDNLTDEVIKEVNINNIDSKFDFVVTLGSSYWGYSQKPTGEYFDELLVFSDERTEENTGKMILNFSEKGVLLLTFYPEYDKIILNNPQVGPNLTNLIQGNGDLYAILSRKDQNTLFNYNGKDFKKLKITFKENSFIILRKDWQNQVKRLTDGLPCDFSQIGIGLDKINENYLLIGGKKIILN